MTKKIDVADIFGSLVFNDATMRERLPNVRQNLAAKDLPIP